MGWETRARGGRYYTRSKKVGGRVVREYVGTGRVAALAAEIDAVERCEREHASAQLRAERDKERSQEATLIDYCRNTDAIMEQALLAAGYHKHKGQWRRKHGTKEENRPGKS